ncbi:DUF1934 domain-containing protein [Streptococcus merionis]|uniref:DUF1934 domain-containing protein n=1 Tax=Streptococcus merionis TaxID=400065 RepID=UPI0035180F4F
MKIHLRNEIQIDEEMEVIFQEFDVQVQEKNGQTYLLYQNEEKEKVVLKFDATELVMTRFSEPKSIMRFVKDQKAIVSLPTPMGIQQFVTDTHHYQLEPSLQQLSLHYYLRPLEGNQLFASYKMVIGWK